MTSRSRCTQVSAFWNCFSDSLLLPATNEVLLNYLKIIFEVCFYFFEFYLNLIVFRFCESRREKEARVDTSSTLNCNSQPAATSADSVSLRAPVGRTIFWQRLRLTSSDCSGGQIQQPDNSTAAVRARMSDVTHDSWQLHWRAGSSCCGRQVLESSHDKIFRVIGKSNPKKQCAQRHFYHQSYMIVFVTMISDQYDCSNNDVRASCCVIDDASAGVRSKEVGRPAYR